jgi:hypothetical protein
MLAAVGSSTQCLIGPAQQVLRNILRNRFGNRVLVRPSGMFASFLIYETALPGGANREARLYRVSKAGISAILSKDFTKHLLLSARARTLSYLRQWLRQHCPEDRQSRGPWVWLGQISNRVALLFCS